VLDGGGEVADELALELRIEQAPARKLYVSFAIPTP
jgi:hypothetical protein